MTATQAEQLGWLLSRFTTATAGIAKTVAVSPRGELVAKAEALAPTDARRLAVLTLSLGRLAAGANEAVDAGGVVRVIVEFDRGHLIVNPVNPQCALGVLAGAETDLEALLADIVTLVHQAGPAVTPALVEQVGQRLVPGREP